MLPPFQTFSDLLVEGGTYSESEVKYRDHQKVID
jgi:hypothetical protein